MNSIENSYRLFIKTHMSRMGIWPEQPKYVAIVWPLTTTAIVSTYVAPQVVVAISLVIRSKHLFYNYHMRQLVRLHDAWGDVKTGLNIVPQLLVTVICFTAIMNAMLQRDKMIGMLQKMELHWKMLKNTSSIVVLEKYSKRVCYLMTIYAIYVNTSLVLYFIALISPVILDFVHPLNETRPKIYCCEGEYGIDEEKYYWLILAHGYILTILFINMIVTTETIFILLVEHACALFEVVGFNLKLIKDTYIANETSTTEKPTDSNYRKICDCMIVHKEAISFAGLVESSYSMSFILVMGITAILISATGIQVLINIGDHETLIRLANFTFGQIFHLYLNSIPGQQLIDHSLKIRAYVYDLNWYDMSVGAQKLLIPILLRSNKPCFLTAGKVYVLSMENFGLAMRTALSYFMIFAQLL